MKGVKKYIILFLLQGIFILSSKAQNSNVYTTPDTIAEFPGGELEMMKFIQKNIKFLETEKIECTESKVFVKFIVEVNGELSDIKILKGMANCPERQKEVIKVISSMPKWKPAIVNNKAVRSYYNSPIIFEFR